MSSTLRSIQALGVVALLASSARAQDYGATATAVRDPFRAGGDVQVLTARELQRLRFDNPEALLLRAPGIYVRTEDGFGLRPNIGMRGVSPERSARIALMEDGVLFGPAPYSAPAAYYFPLMARVADVGVYHGPAAVPFGPHTVGGAIDFRTTPIPEVPTVHLDAMGGAWGSLRAHGRVGATDGPFGGLLEVIHLRSDGFKHLDGGGNTGFDRTEVMGRVAVTPPIGEGLRLRIEAQSTLSFEGSNETYVGLTDADFRADPYRRYAASQRDRMEWWRVASRATVKLEWGDSSLTFVAYRHDFHRVWLRANRFRDGPSIAQVLAAPDGGQERVYAELLRGESDASTRGEALLLARNDRRFVSQGAQLTARVQAETGDVRHYVLAGLRFHHDAIERNHTEEAFLMQSRVLVPEGTAPTSVLRERGSAHTVAAFASYAVRWDALVVTPGVRLEWIATELLERRTGVVERGADQLLVLPALDASVEVLPRVVVFGGVHRGFSPVAPGQAANVRPEEATSFELGARYAASRRRTFGELTAFYVDYVNLLGQCTASSGCAPDAIDQQFNGGAVDTFGLELAGGHTVALTDELSLPMRATYTFTHATFGSSFRSESPQFGDVVAGDFVPYVPMHQGSAEVGVDSPWLQATVTGSVVSAMRERPGQGDTGPRTDDAFFLDALVRVRLVQGVWAYARGENLTFSTPVASRFPMGARPGRPFTVQAGLTIDL